LVDQNGNKGIEPSDVGPMGFPIAQVSKQEMQRSRRANKASMGLNKLEKVRDSQAVQ